MGHFQLIRGFFALRWHSNWIADSWKNISGCPKYTQKTNAILPNSKSKPDLTGLVFSHELPDKLQPLFWSLSKKGRGSSFVVGILMAVNVLLPHELRP